MAKKSPPRGHVGGLLVYFILNTFLLGHRNAATTIKLDLENSRSTSVGAKRASKILDKEEAIS